MLCGFLPFEDHNTPLLYKKIVSGDFSIPKFVSPHAKHLILGLLITDPERRMKLRDIKSHPWFTNTSEKSIKDIIGIKVAENKIPIDAKILSQMGNYNEKAENTRRYLENNRHNHSTTVYYLLLKKQLKNGIQS